MGDHFDSLFFRLFLSSKFLDANSLKMNDSEFADP